MKKNYILKIALLFVVIALVSGIYTFIVIPSVRKDMQKQFDEKIAMQLKSHRQVLVYNGATPLLEGSVITEVNRENFILIQMAKDAITSNYVTSFDDVIGCEVKYTICSGQQVSYENFTDFISTNDADERLKEFVVTIWRDSAAEISEVYDRVHDRVHDRVGEDKSLIQNELLGDGSAVEKSDDRASGGVYDRVPDRLLEPIQKNIIQYCSVPRSTREILEHINYKYHPDAIAKMIKPLLSMGYLELTIPDKPNSPKQKYRKK